MYQYTNNSLPSFNKEGSYHSLPDTYYQSTQPPQQQQNYGWYSQQPMAAASAPVLAHPPIETMTTALPPLPPTTTETPPSPPHLSNTPAQRPKITTSLWEDEGTICYQVMLKVFVWQEDKVSGVPLSLLHPFRETSFVIHPLPSFYR
ncbi:unnamed protein product [Absidia cylindrospora]